MHSWHLTCKGQRCGQDLGSVIQQAAIMRSMRSPANRSGYVAELAIISSGSFMGLDSCVNQQIKRGMKNAESWA